MSDRPTPETDKNIEDIGMGCQMVNVDFARTLERERDETREALANEISFHHRTHSELVEAQCKLLDAKYYDQLKS